MANAIIIIGFLAMFHYIYEAILAPTFRLKIRHELFELRDSLHKIKLEKLSQDDIEVVMIIEKSINHILDRMTHVNLINIVRLRSEYANNNEFKKIIDSFNQKLKASHNAGIKKIDQHLTLLTAKALVANIGALLFYLLPLFALARLVSSVYKRMKKWVETNSQGFLLTPENRYSHLSFS
jgi:hypothetical protein